MVLVARYIEADTTPAEEEMLAAYYASNEADEDEVAVARMICMEHTTPGLLSKDGEEEFERIINIAPERPLKRRRHFMIWSDGIAAAIALLLFIGTGKQDEPEQHMAFDTVEIVEHAQQIMNLNMEDVAAITASPVQECVLLKATLNDGTTKTFIMSKSEEKGSTSILAID